MKGLLKKDVQILCANWLILALILAGGIAISIYIKIPSMLICFIGLLLSYQGLATILNDQSSGWFPWEFTLPVKKEQIIYEKFILCLLIAIVGLLVALIMSFAVSKITNVPLSAQEIKINLSIFMIFVGLGISCGILLCFYKKESGPIAMFVAVLLPIAVVLVVIKCVADVEPAFLSAGIVSMILYFVIMELSPRFVMHWLSK